ncbi:MAG TPA: molybdopterin molybdotransferase MoeA [Pedobacter sp.]
MISYIEAQNLSLSQAKSFGTEILSLDEADGRVLAEDVFADRDYPPFNRSAMDGYAIRFSDWENGIQEFKVQEVIYAGKIPEKELESGSAFKIMTGSAVPFPADTVIRREDSNEENQKVSFTIDTLKIFQNIARKGEDLKKGQLTITAATLCTPSVISTLATLGKSSIRVECLPRLALFTTGNEVKHLHEEVLEFEIRNSNSYLIKSLLKQWAIFPSAYKHLKDDKEELEIEISKALKYDIIILSGGISAGDADYVPGVLKDLGVEKLFHKVAIKPGKPIWCGNLPGGPMVFALPGNPFSSLVTFKLFIEPFLQKSFGLTPSSPTKSFFKGEKGQKTTFDEFFPARIMNAGTQVEATALNGSGDIRLGIDADVLAIHPKDADRLSDGQVIDYYPL